MRFYAIILCSIGPTYTNVDISFYQINIIYNYIDHTLRILKKIMIHEKGKRDPKAKG